MVESAYAPRAAATCQRRKISPLVAMHIMFGSSINLPDGVSISAVLDVSRTATEVIEVQ